MIRDWARGSRQFTSKTSSASIALCLMMAIAHGQLLLGLRNIGYTGAVIHEVSGDRDFQIEMAKRMRQIMAGEASSQ